MSSPTFSVHSRRKGMPRSVFEKKKGLSGIMQQLRGNKEMKYHVRKEEKT